MVCLPSWYNCAPSLVSLLYRTCLLTPIQAHILASACSKVSPFHLPLPNYMVLPLIISNDVSCYLSLTSCFLLAFHVTRDNWQRISPLSTAEDSHYTLHIRNNPSSWRRKRYRPLCFPPLTILNQLQHELRAFRAEARYKAIPTAFFSSFNTWVSQIWSPSRGLAQRILDFMIVV